MTYSLEILVYPNPAKPGEAGLPSRAHLANKRDVLAFGLGRRVEDNVGTDHHMMSVKDWRTARSRGNVSSQIAYGPDGYDYSNFFNPDCSGRFLTDRLRDKKSTIRLIDSSSSPQGLLGFEVSYPQAGVQTGELVRVWADPAHGFMPAIVEKWDVHATGHVTLSGRTKVKEFIEIGDACWAPVRGIHEDTRGAGVNTGIPYGGTVLVVDVKRSSWNSINSDALFAATSLAEVNWVRADGYKQYFQPADLAVLKQVDQAMAEGLAEAAAESTSVTRWRWIFTAASALLLALLVGVVIGRHRRSRLGAIRP